MVDYNSYKATELKELLKERGLPVTGLTRKQQYIDALIANDVEASDGADGEDAATAQTPDAVTEDAKAAAQTPPPPEAMDIVDETAPANATAATEPEMTTDDTQADGTDDAQIGHDAGAPPTDTIPDAQPTNEVIPADDANQDSRKRKRRSPTPPPSEEVVNKKLKAAEDKNGVDVKLPEDTVDHVAQSVGHPNALVESVHPHTSSIYICELLRPIRPAELRDHLSKLSIAPGSDREELVTSYIDTNRTHAFASFETVDAAVRVRSALHGVVWPDERSRKPLSVDFVPDDKIKGWVDIEEAGVEKHRAAKRWEVVYTNRGSDVIATHEESGRRLVDTKAAPARPQSSGNAEASMSPDTQSHEQSASVFHDLAKRFESTQSLPKLYYKPVDQDLATRRLDELNSLTSRDWEPRHEYGTGPGGTLRRFTYDDGDRLVDGGPDLGDFGRFNSGPRRGGGGGRGGGWGRGGGGFRGRR